jgi:large repetitive protein
LQMAVDGKIYCASSLRNAVSVINNPSIRGSGCSYSSNSVSLGTGISYIGLPFRMAVTSPEINAENICINEPSVFSIKWSTDAISVNWDFGDSSTSDQSNPSHAYSEAGVYTVTATVVGQGRTWVVSKEITVLPMAPLVFSEMCEDDIHMLTVQAQDNLFNLSTATVAWTGPNGFTADTATIATPATGLYTVVITPTEGCPTTATYTVDSIGCFIPRGISPNNDGFNDNLELTEFKVTHLTIFNRYGVLVYEADNYTSQWHGQTSKDDELPSGTYYYLAELPSGKKKSGWIYVNRQS